MKKLIFLLFLLIPFNVFSQAMQDVIYLKNGSVVRGEVTETKPNQSVKIQTRDGSVFVYDFSEVEKITKEKAVKVKTGHEVFHKGYRGFFDVGYKRCVSHFDNDGISFMTVHGIQMNSWFFVGAGIGLQYYYDNYEGLKGNPYSDEEKSAVSMPLFVDFRTDMIDGPVSPFIDIKFGYGLLDAKGIYFSPSCGVRFKLHKDIGINVGVGYTIQNTKLYYDYSEPFHFVDFKIGVDF